MRLMPISAVPPGTTLAQPVFDAAGRLMLAAGAILSRRHLDLLSRLGYVWLYVSGPGPHTGGCVLDPPKRHYLTARVRELQAALLGREPEPPVGYHLSARAADNLRPATAGAHELSAAAQVLVGAVMAATNPAVVCVDTRSLYHEICAHQVQVALLAVTTARTLGYARRELLELAAGALFHDVGQLAASWEEATGSVRTHPEVGFELLRRARLGLLAAHVAYGHHECPDGSGYPRGVSGEQIPFYARLVAVCDAFDLLVAPSLHGPSLHPAEALSRLADHSGSRYDAAAVRALRMVVAPYPVGTRVRLSDGRTATVVAAARPRLDRPLVFTEGPRPERVDLAACPHLCVVDYLPLDEAGPAWAPERPAVPRRYLDWLARAVPALEPEPALD